MTGKGLPFGQQQLEEIAERYPTPFHIYDERAIRENAARLKEAFAWNEGFKEYFAVKATPNPYIMKLLQAEGFGSDCSSMAELLLSETVGITGENIMFTSNDTPAEEFQKACALGAIINLDDITHFDFLEKNVGIPELACFRYNPGPLREGNTIIGHPEEAKYGFTKNQLAEGYAAAKAQGINRFGIHTMVASNELNAQYFIDTAEMLFSLVAEFSRDPGVRFEFVNIGGGIGIPYKPEDKAVDLNFVSNGIQELYSSMIEANGLAPLRILMECGRMITGPYGFLVSRVRHIKNTYKKFVGLDACMADLMRPALYGAYHHITVMGKEEEPAAGIYDVTGSLCENNDKFAIDRELPEIEPGDLLVIHDAGAHGHAMGFNYNGKLRSAELLMRPDGDIVEIRRAETTRDLFATLDMDGLKDFQV
jgi:diaminopimelate decarboxylase